MNSNYHLDTTAVIRSLQEALTATHDFSQAQTRLQHMVNRMPEGNLQICPRKNGVFFYEKNKYLRKDSDRLYPLARKRYLEALLKTIEQYAEHARTNRNKLQCDKAFAALAKLIRNFAAGHLELERIILTRKQYKWFYSRYIQKLPPDYDDFKIPQGDIVRSKSEQQIGIEMHLFAVPCHYEQKLDINVQKLVRILESDLLERKQLHGRLFTYQGNTCFWNVPEEFSWMNAPGSVWRTYNSRTGCITLHPDYAIMLVDGSILYWEHEGLLQHMDYRINAQERIGLMQLAGITDSQIIRTTEQQANDREALQTLIQTKIPPRLWF